MRPIEHKATVSIFLAITSLQQARLQSPTYRVLRCNSQRCKPPLKDHHTFPASMNLASQPRPAGPKTARRNAVAHPLEYQPITIVVHSRRRADVAHNAVRFSARPRVCCSLILDAHAVPALSIGRFVLQDALSYRFNRPPRRKLGLKARGADT